MTGRRLSRSRVGDAAVTLAPTMLVLLMSASTLAARHADMRRPMLAVLLAQALPLLVVRRFPWAVLGWTATVTSVGVAIGVPGSNGAIAQAIAMAFVVARTAWPASAAVPVAVLAVNLAGAWAGHLSDLPRETFLTVTTLALGWIVGDAFRRREAVQGAMEAELVRRARHHRLQAEVGALSERLTIARELHRIVGEGLDAIVVQAGAARTRLGTPDAMTMITAIEAVAREVLAELDRFLTLLRLEVPERETDRTATAVPVHIPDGRRFMWLEKRAPALTLIGTAALVSALTYIDIAAVPDRHPLPWWWPLAFSGAVGAILTARRRWPEATLTVLTLLIAGHHAAGIEVYNGVVAIPLAAYALMVHRSRRRGMVLATLACAMATMATAIGAPSATVEVGSVLTMLTAAALYVGDTARVARAHNTTLARRLSDTEAEGALRRHAAVVAERTAAARDLHDSVGHALSLIIIQAGAARLGAGLAAPGAPHRADNALAAIEETARTSLTAVEAAVSAGDGTGTILPDAVDIERLVGAVRATGATVHIDAVGTEHLPRSLQSTVYRLVQEALTNVVKHAPGATTSVVVDLSDGMVRVRVANSRGRGQADAVHSGGRGLTGMRERVALFGGQLDVGPAPDGGYLVDAAVRVPETVDSAEAAPQEVGGRP